MSNDYNKVSKQLKPEEHILLRPNMYIGSVSTSKFQDYLLPDDVSKKVEVEYVSGLLKLVYEIIDNSVDIAIKTKFKHGTKIDILLDKESCTVQDNGTGIPVVMVQDANGNDVWNPVLSWCYTMAGTNFDSDEEGRLSMGMNGVGSTVTSIFSKEFIGETSDGKNKLIVKTINNNVVDKVTVKESTQQYTKVSFRPDFDRFEVDNFTDDHIKIVRDRVYKLAATYPEIKLSLNGEKISMKKMTDIVAMYNPQHLIEKDDKVVIALYENKNDDFEFVTTVNGLSIINGGSHIDYVADRIATELRPLIEKKHKIKVLPAQIKQHLFLGVFIRDFPNMKFDSQTKERITNSREEINNFIKDIDFAKLAANMMKNSETYVLPIIEYQLMKLQQAERRKADAEGKKALQENVAKHISPLNKKGSDNIFYLVEGDSAKNNFQPTRDKQRHGMYPLRGKFINTTQRSTLDILDNKEAKDIMSILGLTIGKPAPDTLRNGYGHIYICADADVDGYCITTQMINFFSLWPELFERGIVKIVYTPIMEIRSNSNKILHTFFTLSEYAKYKLKSNEKIKYLKGLGSLNTKEYKEYLIESPKVEAVTLGEDDAKFFGMLFGKESDPRKEWLGE